MVLKGLLFSLILFSLSIKTTGKPSRRAACSRGEWRCNNGRCVPSSYKCDGVNQCGDNSDEKEGCFDLSGACGSGRMCRSILKCVTRSQLCNGVDNCGDGSDEEGCSRRQRKLIPNILQRCFPVKCPTGQPVRDAHGFVVHCGPGTDNTIHTCPGNTNCFVDPADSFAICCPP